MAASAAGTEFVQAAPHILPLPTPLVEGLTLPECPRWREGALYFSDIQAGRVHRHRDGATELVAEFDDFVGGLGFLPDGDLLCVLSKSRTLQRIAESGPSLHADLSGLCRFVLNDMVVRGGRAYVSQPGFDIWSTSMD